MVFESVVSEVLNVYLGNYVENLDKSQLKIGIWGGDVVLQDLTLKQNVLDNLNLPLKTVFGHIGKIVLKIPWKNLYSAPVVASLEELFLLVVPNTEDQHKYMNRAKQAELQRLEVTRKLMKEKAETKSDKFAEKLATQIIRNLQVKICNVHIRYEDEMMNPEYPFSVGFTLFNLTMQTTDKNWKEGILQDADSIIYKVLNLEGLGIYWNCHTFKFNQGRQKSDLIRLFQDNIFTRTHSPEGVVYVLSPISLSSRLQLNRKPESGGSVYKTPKILLTLLMNQLALSITKEQYHCFLDFLEYFNQKKHLSVLQKYRPSVPRSFGYFKQWWRYAVTCVLKQIGHKSHGTDWNAIVKHRSLCRTYAAAFRRKLLESVVAPEVQEILEECEENLDVFNIMLVRQQMEAEVDWLNRQKKDTKVHSKILFSNWFGSGTSGKGKNLTDKFIEELSSEERLKLYQAIDYKENALPPQYPPEFVETCVHFCLKSLKVDVVDDSLSSIQVLLGELSDVLAKVELRPSANAMKIAFSMGKFTVSGVGQQQFVSSRFMESGEPMLVNILFETNPLDGMCDQRLRMSSSPLTVIYDAHTVNRLVEIFHVPHSAVLSQIQAVADSQFSALKEISARKLQQAIGKHATTEIDVDLKSPLIIIPFGGSYNRREDGLVATLGHLSVSTVTNKLARHAVKVLKMQDLFSGNTAQAEWDMNYDHFVVQVNNIQALMVLASEDWETTIYSQQSTSMHLLEPTSLIFHLEKQIVKHDVSLPNLRISGKLPSVRVKLEEKRLISLITLFRSIPLPVFRRTYQDIRRESQSISMMNHKQDETEALSGELDPPPEAVQLDLKFELGGFKMFMYKSNSSLSRSDQVEEQMILDFHVLLLEVALLKTTYEDMWTASLRGVILKYTSPQGTLTLLDPSSSIGQLGNMVTFKHVKVDARSPVFHSKYESFEQLLVIDFSHLSVLLHQEALLALLEYESNLRRRLESSCHSIIKDDQKEDRIIMRDTKNKFHQNDLSNCPVLKMKACMHELKIHLMCNQHQVAQLLVEGLEASVSFTKPFTHFVGKLKNITVFGPDSTSMYYKVLSILGNEALSLEILNYNQKKGNGKNNVDMSIEAKMACSRIVYLDSFTASVLQFLNKFHQAQEEFTAAVAEATQAAKEGMLKMHAEAKFIQIRISFQAPLIVVPVNSTSLDTLHMDFGKLTIRNMLLPQKANQNPGLDMIQLDLQNLQLSRVSLSNQADIVSTHTLLEPVSFVLHVNRNLSTDSYTDVPDISMQGFLENVELSLTVTDVHMIVGILSENLSGKRNDSTTVRVQSHELPEEITSELIEKKPIAKPICWELKLSVNKLKATVGMMKNMEVLLTVQGFGINIHKKSDTKVAFTITDIKVMDHSPCSFHRKILEVIGQEALSSEVVMYSCDKVQSRKMSLQVQMSCFRVIYQNELFLAIKEFLNEFQEVGADFASVVSSAAEAAKQGVLQAQKSLQISLDINLKAPIVIVPVNSGSSHALLLDLGNLVIKNKFVTVKDASTGQEAVIDELQFGLQDLKVFRVLLESDGSIATELCLLEPVNFLLQVKRNLCASWFKTVPDIDIKGHLKSVVVAMNQNDIEMLLLMLSGISSSSDNVSQKQHSEVSDSSSNASKSSGHLSGIPVRFSFTMDNLVIELFDYPTLMTGLPLQPHVVESSLGRFTLHVLGMNGLICSNGSISTTLLLLDCWLDDTRHGQKTKVTRLMERKSEVHKELNVVPSSSVPRNVEITYTKKEQHTDVNIQIFSFDLTLNVEYLKMLAAFFSAILHSKNVEALNAGQYTSFASDNSPSSYKQITESNQKTMTVNFHAYNPDIYLVEDMKDLNTNALVLQSGISLSVHQRTAATDVKGSVKEFQLYSCCYNVLQRKKTLSQILLPCNVIVEGSTSQMDITIPDIQLKISPGTIGLCDRVLQAIYSKDGGEMDANDENCDLTDLWKAKPINNSEFWFLNKEGDKNQSHQNVKHNQGGQGERCVFHAPSISLTLEVCIGAYSLPGILMSTSLNATIRNWSSQLSINSEFSIQMDYYNHNLAVWEPLIEPVEKMVDGHLLQRPWPVIVKLERMNPKNVSPDVPSDLKENNTGVSTNVTVCSMHNLELVITKASLDVLMNLATTFQKAVNDNSVTTQSSSSPYTLTNYLDVPVALQLDVGPFKGLTTEEKFPVVRSGKSISLIIDDGEPPSVGIPFPQRETDEKILKIMVHQFERTLEVPLMQTNKRYFSLSKMHGLVSDVFIESGGIVVTLKSIVQVFNCLNVPIDIHCQSTSGSEIKYVTTVASEENTSLPLYAVYTNTKELFFSIPGFSKINCKWAEISIDKDSDVLYECRQLQTSDEVPHFLKVDGSVEQAYFEKSNTKVKASSYYKLYIRPPVVLKNLLPFSLECVQNGIPVSEVLNPGEHLKLTTVKPDHPKFSFVSFSILGYCQKTWTKCGYKISYHSQEFSILQFECMGNNLDIGTHTEKRNGLVIITLYSPFWFLNKTGLHLSYWLAEESTGILQDPCDEKSPMLFPSFFANKKTSVKVDGGLWSDRFSIDVAGNSGVISCRSLGQVYKIGAHITLMHTALTKQVTFTPYYVLINNSHHTIECQEADYPADRWLRIEKGSCSALWPRYPDNAVSLRARVVGYNGLTPAFSCSTVHTTLLQLKNKHGALNVDVQITEGAVYIKFASYEPGQAPALLVNNTNIAIPLTEKGSDSVIILNPREMVMFTWFHPHGLRELEWDHNIDKEVCGMCKDGYGVFQPLPDLKVYWISFLDGLQRILLFSFDNKTHQQDAKSALHDVTIMVHGVGISVVNNLKCIELLYFGISRKPRQIKRKLSRQISTVAADSEMGLWVHIKLLQQELQLHMKVHHLQIDNQLAACTYPVALAPVTPSRSIVSATLRPFAEMSIVCHSMKQSSLRQFKYFKVLIQEFYIKSDMQLVNEIYTLLKDNQTSDDVETAQFKEDCCLVGAPLRSHVAVHAIKGQKNFYDLLHFSPLLIHLSFSLKEEERQTCTPFALRALLKSFHISVASVQDVVFKLAYFECKNTFLTNKQLVSEAVDHYKSQALKQMYVLVLGLDVLGNPYGLVRGISRGIEDLFYEPIQGAIQGPGEFAEGLVLGVRSLLSHTVGGAAGAMSRITGAVGKGLAALTFDEGFQKKRQEALNTRPTNVRTSLAQGSKGIVKGVLGGVSGIFTKPISGAKKEGVEGFFKGVGKGVVGLVAQPSSRIIDFASGSLDAVQRSASIDEEIQRQRPPRFFHRDGQIHPYVRVEAEGKSILQDLEDKLIASTDCYECHLNVEPRKSILMLTNKRIIFLTHVEAYNKWRMEWEHSWNTLSDLPFMVPNRIYIPIKSFVRGMENVGGTYREVKISDPEKTQWFIDKMKVLMQP